MQSPLAEIAQQQFRDFVITQKFILSVLATWLLCEWVGPYLARVPATQRVIAFVERRFGVRPGRAPRVDLIYWLLNPAVRVVARACVTAFMLVGGVLLSQELGGEELMKGFGPVTRQPRWLLVVELFLFADLASYWIHRWCHTVPWLWRLHSIHHSSTEIMWTSTARQHPLNEVLNGFNVLPLFLLGFPVNLLLPYGPAVGLYAIFQHTGLNISWGPLRGIINSPNFHRWHHTHSNEGGNKNFANVFSFWDRLFGTFYMPEDRLPEVFGLDREVIAENFVTQFLHPFRSRSPETPAEADKSTQAPTAALPAEPNLPG